ncbi:MAG: tetratricopeptide repeat protein [Phormidesmis sp.]
MASDPFQRALDLIEVERPFDALPLLDAVIAAEPERVEAYRQRAKLRRRLKNYEGAIADYTKALKLKPEAQTYLARALVWLSLDQVRGAISDSREAVLLKPELAGGHRLLGKSLGLLGDGVGAIAAYKNAARCYLTDRDKKNAQACIDAIGPLQQLPPFRDSAAVQNAITSIKSLATPEAYWQRSQQKYDQGLYTATLKDLAWLLAREPRHLGALCLKVLAQAQLGQRKQAVADLALVKHYYPNDSEVQFCRGQMRLILKDGYGAIEEFSALINQDQMQPMARYFAQRGHSYWQIGELENAFKDFSNAIAIDTENAELYKLRADMQKEMGATEGAIADYQRAATLWLNEGNWQQHQSVVESVRRLRNQAITENNVKSATVSIKSYNNHLPVVEVLLDGIATFDIVIDRNATHSIITQQMASRLNLESVSYRYVYLADGTPMELSIGRLRSVAVGGTIITDVYVAIAPDTATAVLGKDCFSAYSVRISGNEITFVHR